MAHVRSLGTHEPSALDYLVGEGILRKDPSPNDYHWDNYGVFEEKQGCWVEEEILRTDTYVVWSRGGVIKRIFGLKIEDEVIVAAFVTCFPREALAENCQLVSVQRGAIDSDVTSSDGAAPERRKAPSMLHRALVVILQSQIHVYFLSGDNHVIPLSFEVESAFPTPTGVVLQRRLPRIIDSTSQPLVPPNSFASSLLTPRLSSGFPFSQEPGPRPSLTITEEPSHARSKQPENIDIPRLFYLLDPQSEIGLVVNGTNSKDPFAGHESRLFPLNPNEELIYFSPKDELSNMKSGDSTLYLAVTYNAKTNAYTTWRVNYDLEPEIAEHTRRKKRLDAAALRRRSSNIFGLNTGATTPVGRNVTSIRESFGGNATSQVEDHTRIDKLGPAVGDLETLADQLGPDFREVGVQTRAARRVSSVLARTDLGTTQDRSTFNELASGHPGRASIGRSYRRGESLGGFSDRASFGPNRRTSARGQSSVFSEGTSFLDAPVDQLLQSLHDSGEFRGFDTIDLDGPISNMAKEVIFTKIETVSRNRGTQPSTTSTVKRPHVFTIISPRTGTSATANAVDDIVSVCIMQNDIKEIVVLGVKASIYTMDVRKERSAGHGSTTTSRSKKMVRVEGIGARRGLNIVDACKIEDGSLSRMLLLTETREGTSILNLEAPWSSSVRIDLPSKMKVHNPFIVSPHIPPNRRRDAGLKRVISDHAQVFQGFSRISCKGQLNLVDQEQKHHRIEICLQPRDRQVNRILDVAMYTLKDHTGDGLLTGWWEVLRWLRLKGLDHDEEWTALVITIFCMAIPFIPGKQARRTMEQRRKRDDYWQSLGGPHGDAWTILLETQLYNATSGSSWRSCPSWEWIHQRQQTSLPDTTPIGEGSSRASGQLCCIQWASLARDFLQTPAGEAAHGPEGYLPTAISKPRELRQSSLATLLISMHLLFEEDKLDIRQATRTKLAPVLAQVGGWLGWESWTWKHGGYYATEITDINHLAFEDSRVSLIEVPKEPFSPPSVFSQFERWLLGSSSAQVLSLYDISGHNPSNSMLRRAINALTPRLQLLAEIQKSYEQNVSAQSRVQALSDLNVCHEILESLPEGIAALMHEVIARTQSRPATDWLNETLRLVDRDDLQSNRDKQQEIATTLKSSSIPHHSAIRDYHTIGNVTIESEPYHFFDSSAEADRQAVTRLIYHEDRRFQDAAKLVNQLRPPLAECVSEPDWTEADLLEAQKDIVQLVTLRTLAVSSGRGMMNFNARIPLLTDKVPIPGFTLQCHMRPMNVTLSADRAAFTEEKVCWAFFHNGVSTGITISRAAKGIDTSWILYNKPPELTNRHAGFLLGLGLNGHLKALAKWVAFKYLTPKHTMVSIGLLLGLSASYMGTMDTLITRLLSVHVTRMLPPGAAELNLSPLTQTAGIMGIGLLYAGSQHRRMSEVMISEIENTDIEELPQNILRDEGYRLAAGFSLGFINIGKGKDLRGLHDMNIVERLLAIAIGTKNVNLVHVLDRATAGATIAIALIFMKTNDAAIAQKIDVPDTLHQFDYVRPDIFLLRTLARQLIMWSNIEATEKWIRGSLPKAYRRRISLQKLTRLRSEDMPFFNILAGLCLALGLRFAGSGSQAVRNLLVQYLDQFIRLTRLSAPNYDAKLARNSVRNCQDVVALAVSAVMAGTGDLQVFRRLRSLHGRVDADTPYGSHLATHMAIGALFLGGGTHTFSTSDLAIGALLCAFYPVFPTFVLDNKAHLQAFRHFWISPILQNFRLHF
ncbi:putative 20s cyclosome subunit (apc1) [Phaeomoniella chlamydospora]|uniref:Putative 20s cyclosome subunit (Apc1) n=1 Tax=Phaeomoniella chlamydospora TaxID=158046 RepID=A0A0G2H384_PHACM|nr:putative 20s cyclosome subunit (apc1) [Phaeomoniella chlamydospora]